MNNSNDLIGQKFGKLTVIEKAKEGRQRYICKCECGNTITLQRSRLPKYKSCGCYEKVNLEIISHSSYKHGKTNTRLYGIWCGMKDRCYNSNCEHYDCYGGRGIRVCDEWLNDFQKFYDWSIQNGYEKGLSIDRIDVDGNYEPSNCRWATKIEQMRNRRDTVFVEDNGIKIPITEACEKYGIEKTFLWRKVKAGYSLSEILTTWNLNHSKDDFMSVSDVAKEYNTYGDKVIKWIKQGKLKAIYYDRRYYIPKNQKVIL